jgi:hypothetical protein
VDDVSRAISGYYAMWNDRQNQERRAPAVDGFMEANGQNMARDLYRRARRQAIIQRLVSIVKKIPNCILALEEIESVLPVSNGHYACVCPVPVHAIVGTVGRYHDFDRNFNPTREHTRERWERISKAMLEGVALPPVELYKVGDAYFVKDGNHRVSVAKHQGISYVDAIVTELATILPVAPGNVYSLAGRPAAT